MDLIKIISELRKERAAVEATLVYLETLARTQGKRRGRPPKYLTDYAAGQTRKPFSDATKKKMAVAQRKRWAAARKTKDNKPKDVKPKDTKTKDNE